MKTNINTIGIIMKIFALLLLVLCFAGCTDSLQNESDAKTSVASESIECKHNYSAKITAKATCIKEGVKTHTCSLCGDSYTSSIPASNVHNYKLDTSVKPTCTEEGTEIYKCENCENTKTKTLDATGHTWKAATCTQAQTCSVCKLTQGDAAKHSYQSSITTEPTCGTSGVKTYTCSGCKDTYTENIAATNQHTYTSKITKKATCNTAGVKTYICSGCKDTYTENIAATNQHTYTSKITKEATCNTAGVKTYTCSGCKDTYTENIAPTTHDYQNGNCKYCGELSYDLNRWSYLEAQLLNQYANNAFDAVVEAEMYIINGQVFGQYPSMMNMAMDSYSNAKAYLNTAKSNLSKAKELIEANSNFEFTDSSDKYPLNALDHVIEAYELAVELCNFYITSSNQSYVSQKFEDGASNLMVYCTRMKGYSEELLEKV